MVEHKTPESNKSVVENAEAMAAPQPVLTRNKLQ
jgi:hypothetical protein